MKINHKVYTKWIKLKIILVVNHALNLFELKLNNCTLHFRKKLILAANLVPLPPRWIFFSCPIFLSPFTLMPQGHFHRTIWFLFFGKKVETKLCTKLKIMNKKCRIFIMFDFFNGKRKRKMWKILMLYRNKIYK